MKVLSFYNEKGGVGKSTFTIMYASWLKYQYGINVGVVDFNNREAIYRRDEIRQKEALGIKDKNNLDNLWPIVNADRLAIFEMERQHSVSPNAQWLEGEIRNGSLKGLDVLLVDLPGATNGREFIELLVLEMVGLWCLVIDRDPQTLRAIFNVNKSIIKRKNQHWLGFINQAQTYVSMKEYEKMSKIYMEAGLKILPDIISFSERMKKISEPDIIRSTIEYPNWASDAFRGSRDLGTENLFIDITKELAKVPDFKGTKKTDLSFVDSLQKEFQEKRQLLNSSFPEYQFPAEMFPKTRLESK